MPISPKSPAVVKADATVVHLAGLVRALTHDARAIRAVIKPVLKQLDATDRRERIAAKVAELVTAGAVAELVAYIDGLEGDVGDAIEAEARRLELDAARLTGKAQGLAELAAELSQEAAGPPAGDDKVVT